MFGSSRDLHQGLDLSVRKLEKQRGGKQGKKRGIGTEKEHMGLTLHNQPKRERLRLSLCRGTIPRRWHVSTRVKTTCHHSWVSFIGE